MVSRPGEGKKSGHMPEELNRRDAEKGRGKSRSKSMIKIRTMIESKSRIRIAVAMELNAGTKS
jgi:hypothetical protein